MDKSTDRIRITDPKFKRWVGSKRKMDRKRNRLETYEETLKRLLKYKRG